MELFFSSEEGAALADGDPRQVGERLFDALLKNQALSLYERSLDLLEGEDDASFRMELIFDPKDPQIAPLQALPWELLRQPGTPEFVALDRRRSIVRYLIVPSPVSAAVPPKKLRILAVAADPRLRGTRPLNLEGELQNLRSAVAGSERLELVELPHATIGALRQSLVEQEFHVLHFLGHGGRHEETGEQVLFFERELRQADPVSGADLMNKLAGFPRLRLVVLNACESGLSPEGSDDVPFNPLAGVAGSLVLGGMPAVIAMRKPVSDPAAISFSRVFYRRLASGDRIDAAVVEGRQEIHSRNRDDDEWATPMLFLRTATGELYPARDLPPEGSSRRGRRLAVAIAALLLLCGLAFAARREWIENRVKGLLAEGVAKVTSGNWAEAREFFAAARQLAPRSGEVAANLAATEEQLGDVQSAKDLYEEAVRRAPESADRLYDLGHFLNDHGNPAEAYSVLSKAVTWPAEAPRSAEAYAELARASLSQKLFARARAAITTALRLDPERAEYQRRRGEIELLADSPSTAIPPLEEALRHFPVGDLGRIETLALLVDAKDQIGDGEAACRYVSEVRILDTAGISPWAPKVDEIAARRQCR